MFQQKAASVNVLFSACNFCRKAELELKTKRWCTTFKLFYIHAVLMPLQRTLKALMKSWYLTKYTEYVT